ncbi:hypothetical protein GCWU000341_00648 [Oribacterium sp. oral taxon 078 str. F0262]|nr:hypothetical protein GCWU000341_00648 [Oribacterium sp. oral taxon 078 str. F0262]
MALPVAGAADGLFMNRSIVMAAGGSFRPRAAREISLYGAVSRRGGRRPAYESADRHGGGSQFPAGSCAGDFPL